ncbi:snRNA-activating protein complex subunit 1-like [Stegastes partitus]|uniref:snRNA-activating protein complex subunit 1-like n=1 Tax=Stegastes partitus TaxID=144197 RepID=A0A9Y4KHJ1_9TELE|nr:PREDICTED: snRNA-activating protein complex subunit 1-like [Stegastes partitus]
MPRVPRIYSDVFDELLTEDVEELLGRFQHSGSIRYKVFAGIWRHMCFSDVFRGMPGLAELKRFCRVTLATAVKYFLPPFSYQIRVGGLYLMFAFYHTQLCSPPVRIRLALKDWACVQKFLEDSADCGHHDVVYVYQKLAAAKAFHFTAMPHVLTFQKQRTAKTGAVCAEFLGRATAVRELMCADILEELSHVQSNYEQLKEACPEVRGQAAMTHRDLASRLKGCMSEFISWQQKSFSSQDSKDEKAGDGEKESSSSRARLLSSIKHKSYSSFQEAPRSRRHRQAETVESSDPGAEQPQEPATVHKKKPPSLRARTTQSLGESRGDSRLHAWLLSAPEQPRPPVRRSSQAAPCRA